MVLVKITAKLNAKESELDTNKTDILETNKQGRS